MSKKARAISSPLIKKLLSQRDPILKNRANEKMAIAAKIGDLLKRKGWKKIDLARKIGQEPSVISKWLSGNHNFTADTLSDLGYIFGESFFHNATESKIVEVTVNIKVDFEENPFLPSYSWGKLSTDSLDDLPTSLNKTFALN